MRDLLRAVPLFADLPNDDIDLLAGCVTEHRAAAGTCLFAEGDAGETACVVTAGEVEVVKATGDREVPLAVRGAGEVLGEMALLDGAPRTASVRARTDVTYLSIPKQQVDHLLQTSPAAVRALYGVLLSRWRDTESRLRQSARMAQLGTLSAGLAHEMNNPAAAVQRGAGQLRSAVERLGIAMGDLRALGLGPEEGSQISGVLARVTRSPEPLGALERSDRETEFEDVLDELGIAGGWDLAPELVAAGITPDEFRTVLAGFDGSVVEVVANAICANADASSLVREVEEGAARLSEIVGALKSYAHLDRAPLQEIDVRRGLDDTLLILRSKLDGIEVLRAYPDHPVVLRAYAAELNQVWTNLLDNAADALTDGATADPRIEIRVAADSESVVVVEIEDNGPGIPDDIVSRVFDAFFTTKPPGSGTGLGLDISYGIVIHRHRGEITVSSRPGCTVFRVELPMSPEAT
jgi:signal transduction histidine kinase